MVYCDYEEFGKNYMESFPKLILQMDDFDEEFQFTYKDLFKPVYDNKYYLFLLFMRSYSSPSEIIKDPPAWTLGRLFLRKYQFVFDALNKKIGYYKVNITEEESDTDIKSDEKTDDINDEEENEKEKETDKKEKENEEEKEKETDKKENENGKNTDDKGTKTDKKDDDSLKENKATDIIFVILFFVVLAIILIVAIVLCCKWLNNKEKRKKRANELIDDAEYNPENQEEPKSSDVL